jgi:hypothetical protein
MSPRLAGSRLPVSFEWTFRVESFAARSIRRYRAGSGVAPPVPSTAMPIICTGTSERTRTICPGAAVRPSVAPLEAPLMSK